MPSKRQVSNKEYEEAYNSSDNQRIIYKVTSKYRPILSEDEIESCAMQALWEALSNHKPDKGQKFTTTLFRYLKWRCNNMVKRVKKHKKFETDFSEIPPHLLTQFDQTNGEIYELMGRYLSQEDFDIISNHVISGMSFEEIAAQKGCSKCRVISRYNWATKFLKEIIVGV